LRGNPEKMEVFYEAEMLHSKKSHKGN